jgi:endonuclease/exonuclease/phosphatase family metal-dependent hydrolase
VRVLALNVQGFRAGVDRVAEVIRATDPDAALLAEVRPRQGKRLAKATGRHLAFGSTRRFRRLGNAVLLRDRPVSVRSVVLSRTRGLEPRGAAIVAGPGGITFVATHLGLSALDRRRDAKALLAALEDITSVVVGGDLNDRPGGPAAQLLLERYTDVFAAAGEGSGETFPATAPLHRIDYVLCSPDLKPVRAAVVPIVASDHLAVLAEITK